MEAGEITLRGYRPADLEALYALDVECFAPPFRFSRAAMRRFAEASRARVVLAERDGELCGFCIVDVERRGGSRRGYIVTLDVPVAQRRRGIAALLMAAVERQCLADGCSAMALHVHTGNEAARRFYERSGYRRSGAAPGFYGAGLDAEVWQKALG
jgi:ribosomal-protein-alanine N-acetyltransferase